MPYFECCLLQYYTIECKVSIKGNEIHLKLIRIHISSIVSKRKSIVKMSLTIFDKTINWKYQPKVRNKFTDNGEAKVEGMSESYNFFRDNHIVQHKCSEDYFDGIFPKKRKYICYAQNIILWISAIRFLILSVVKNEIIDILLANILIKLDRPVLPGLCLTLTITMFSFMG